MDLLTVAVSIVSAGLTGGGATALVGAIRDRRTAPADITTKLNAAAMAQVDQLQERVKEADETTSRTQRRLHEVEQEAEDTRQQLRAVRREAADLAERLSALARWIHDPYMSIEQLRVRVPLPPGRNGVG